jgi:hypothetical protein
VVTVVSGDAGAVAVGTRRRVRLASLVAALVPGIVLLFPDGRFPSRRWRPLMWAYIVVGGLWVAGTWIISVGAIVTHHVRIASNGDLSALDNPAGAAVLWGIVGSVFFVLIAVSWLAWLTGQVLSYRRTSGDRRQQLKWLLSGATVFILGTVTSVWLNNANGLLKVVGNITSVAMFALPVSIGFGILKCKLYVTGLLVGVSVGLVLLATQALPVSLSTPVAVAGATLVAAALFSPLRRRVHRVLEPAHASLWLPDSAR